MIAVRVMQHTIDEVVHMIAVRHRFMPAAGTMNMARCGAVLRGPDAAVGMTGFDLDPVFVVVGDLAADQMGMMQMSVMEVVNMAAVFDRGMPAVSPVSVMVICVCLACTHDLLPRWSDSKRRRL